MICCGTTRAVVMLALLSITQTSWTAEPTSTHSQTERIRVNAPSNSLKFTISDPAARGLVGPATRMPQRPVRRVEPQAAVTKPKQSRSIRTVNHEAFTLSPRQQQVLIAQLGEDKARDALDALRSVTDDLDLTDVLENVDNAPARNRQPARTPQTTDTDVRAILEKLNQERSVRDLPATDDATRAEQRKRDLESLLETVEEERSKLKEPDTQRNDDLPDEADDYAADDYEADVEDTDVEPAMPQSIYAKNTNYKDIPWTMGDMFEGDEKTWEQQCREQEMCRQMWECAGGKCMSASDRMRRNTRRTYELLNGECPNNNSFPLLSGIIVEPLLGYGFFGAPVGGGAPHCHECNVGLIAGSRVRPGTGGGLFGAGGPLGLGILRSSCSCGRGSHGGLLKGGHAGSDCGGACTSSCTTCGACGGSEQSCTSCTCGG